MRLWQNCWQGLVNKNNPETVEIQPPFYIAFVTYEQYL